MLTLAQIKRFVCYCRAKCAPRLSEEAARTLQSEYVAIRDNARQRAISTGSEEAIPITVRLPSTPFLSRPSVDQNARTAQVRQLEALVRVSEALSKMRLSAEVSSRDVREVSTRASTCTFPTLTPFYRCAGPATVQGIDDDGGLGWALEPRRRRWRTGGRR